MRAELAEKAQAGTRRTAIAAAAGAAALGVLGLLLLRGRNRLGALFRKISLDGDEPDHSSHQDPAPDRASRPGAEPRKSAGKKATLRARVPTAPTPSRAGARKVLVQDLLRKTEEMVQFARQADVFQQHQATLMEWEAELQAISSRVGDPFSDLSALHDRLKHIAGGVRALKFKKPAPPPGSASESRPAAPTVEEEPTYYELLNVGQNATQGEIKQAYHELLKQYHPDLHNNSDFSWVKEQADNMSKNIAKAYEVLSEASTRAAYDREMRRKKTVRP